MRDPRPGDDLGGPELGPDVVVRNAARRCSPPRSRCGSARTVQLLGVVGDEEILAVIAGSDSGA